MAKKTMEAAVLEIDDTATIDMKAEPIGKAYTEEVYESKYSKKNDYTDDEPLVNCLRNERIIVRYVPKANSLITNPKHFVIESAHPSPFSARNGFFGSKPFSRCNNILKENGIEPINWEVR